MDSGVLTEDQLEELIAYEAGQIDLTFAQAVERAQDNTLPRDLIGTNLRLLMSMLLVP